MVYIVLLYIPDAHTQSSFSHSSFLRSGLLSGLWPDDATGRHRNHEQKHFGSSAGILCRPESSRNTDHHRQKTRGVSQEDDRGRNGRQSREPPPRYSRGRDRHLRRCYGHPGKERRGYHEVPCGPRTQDHLSHARREDHGTGETPWSRSLRDAGANQSPPNPPKGSGFVRPSDELNRTEVRDIRPSKSETVVL